MTTDLPAPRSRQGEGPDVCWCAEMAGGICRSGMEAGVAFATLIISSGEAKLAFPWEASSMDEAGLVLLLRDDIFLIVFLLQFLYQPKI